MKKIRVGITGYTGFIGSHLVDRLSRESNISIVPIDDSLFQSAEQLKDPIKNCDCIVHFAGMNRGEEKEIYATNIRLSQTLVKCFEETDKKPHLIFASSILSNADSAFGRSKKESCDIFADWAKRNKANVSLLTIPNVFGDRGKPFYNSVIATFCYQLTHGQEPKVIQDREIELIYINELIDTIVKVINQPSQGIQNIRIPGTKNIKVSELLKILENFKDCFFKKRVVPSLTEPFLINLYNVFLSYLDYDDLSFTPQVHGDERGELFEIVKLAQGGQVFFSTTKPGIVRGNHYHIRKLEKFCVLKGNAIIRMRRIGTDKIQEFKIDSRKPTFIDIPIFHTHHIENAGQDDLLTLFWSNELFDAADPDIFYEEVVKS
ncbi:MAG: NAD-dependent epimerase/dehydratase family protein [Candidatus Margulisbacteria bacterium]|nr:NAD-dependent epimerase/dehydratase family protein [Candidatus Margulisiibacteriota bacterium]MBU1728647.1 NAD-dependent epimerase/dehydratase family protein [Candidatus Margulisiibacteriota bacterium]MBU1955098.1 NAD-dependent epimerase/dehydratase family protein [Candidatus Margulisiibacteriota bacterium]